MTPRICNFAVGALFALWLLAPVAHGQFREGDTVEVQWGEQTVRGRVDAVVEDELVVEAQVDGQKEIVESHRKHAKRVEDPSAPLGPPRIRVGDRVREMGSRQEGKVVSLHGATARVLVEGRRRTSRPREREMLIAELDRLDADGKARKASGSGPTFREWVDITGKHKVLASFVAVKDGKVQLKRKSNDRVFELPIEKLSKKDQVYLKSREVRFVEFTPPSGKKPQFAAVSPGEKFAVIGFGGERPRSPMSTFAVLDLTKKKKWRNVKVGPLDECECRAISDNGRYVVTEHRVTKGKRSKWFWTIWDCSKLDAKSLEEIEKSPSDAFVDGAKWIDESRLFLGDSEGKVRLFEVDGAKVKEVYAKQVGEARSMRAFSISPSGKFFAVENGKAGSYDVYSTSTCKRLTRVPSKAYLEHVVLTDRVLAGMTSFKQTVVWDLRKKKLAGGARMQASRNATYLGSPSTRMWPLSGSQGVFVRKISGELGPKSVIDFSTGQMSDLVAPNVIAAGSERRIWYVNSNGKNSRFQAYTIPMELTASLRVP